MPGLPDRIAREAYSQEVASAGFWAGGVTAAEPFFYSYIYPEARRLSRRDGAHTAASTRPTASSSCPMPRCAPPADPAAMLGEFFQSAYEAGADLAKWDRAALEREPVAP